MTITYYTQFGLVGEVINEVLAVHCLISLHITFIHCRKFRHKYILSYVVIRVSGFAVNLKQ